MNLCSVIIESLSRNCFFGRDEDIESFKAFPRKVVSNLGDEDIVQENSVYKIGSDGCYYPYSFSVEDILYSGWAIREFSRQANSGKKLYSGVVKINETMVSSLETIFTKHGYGVINGIDYISQDLVKVYCESHLFDRPISGKGTPEYELTFDDNTKTLTAKRIGV